MKVSVAVVTGGRERFMPALYECYARQTFRDTELLVLDDSPEPSPFFAALDDPRVRYWHAPERLTIGRKRNMLAERAAGEWICHFDDDDYYAETYVAQMLAWGRDAGFVKLAAWFNLSVGPRVFTYWDTRAPDALSYRQSGKGLVALVDDVADVSPLQHRSVYGYGFSYFYRREVARRHPFGDMNLGEDYPMAEAFLRAGGVMRLAADRTGLVLHQLHGNNTSTVAPQYRLPLFLLDEIFPGYARYEAVLRGRQAEGWRRARQRRTGVTVSRPLTVMERAAERVPERPV